MLMKAGRVGTLLVALLLATAGPVAGVELIRNGGFENPMWMPLQGWSTPFLGQSVFYGDETANPHYALPHRVDGGQPHGQFIAISDYQQNPAGGTAALLQSFVVAPGATSVVLSFDLLADNWNGSGAFFRGGASDLDPVGVPNQHFRVDILSAAAGAFDTGAGVLQSLLQGELYLGFMSPFNTYSFDITGLVGGGGSFQLRFAVVQNLNRLTVGVDNVSIQAVPEPESYAMMIAGLGLIGLRAWHRRPGR